MTNKNIKNYILIKEKLYFVLFISLFYMNYCYIEIPFKPLKVRGISKYRNITFDEPLINNNKKLFNTTILTSEGGTKLNDNFLFLGTIKIGSNNQQFNLVLDTGSYIIWVPKQGSKDKYTITNHFDPSKSTSSTNTKQSFTQKYGTGYCDGYYYKDNILYIGSNKANMKFGVADNTDFEVNGADGIIGLAHMYYDSSLSFIHNLKNSKIIDSLSFSFLFEGEIDIPMSGKLILGKHKHFSNKNVTTCPLINKGETTDIYWACEISSVVIENLNSEKSTSNKKYNIIFDTGTNRIMLPLAYYEDLKSKIKKYGCSGIRESSGYLIECPNNSPIQFSFKINGYIYTLPLEFSYYSYYNNRIRSLVIFTDEFAIIGSPFFVVFHTLFDKDNEKLRFYTEYKNIVKKDSMSFATIIGIIAVVLVVLIILGCLIYRIVIWKRAKRAANDIPSSNYTGYNNNFL